MRAAFVDALVEVAETDPDVWLLCADLGFGVLERFADRFPERYLNVGVAEQNMIGIASGLALSGYKVFVYSIANFPTQRCLEQIRLDVCYHDAHVIVTAVGGGFSYGTHGYSHHAIEDLAVMRALPGMRVVAPGDPHETKAFVHDLARTPGPGYLRLGRGGEAPLHEGPLSAAPHEPVLMREGNDVTLLGTGAILSEVMLAAHRLAEHGISARVLSVPLLKPLAADALMAQIAGRDLVVTVEEHSLIGGLRDAVAPLLAARSGSPRLLGIGITDGQSLGVTNGQSAMREHCGLDAASVAERVRATLRD